MTENAEAADPGQDTKEVTEAARNVHAYRCMQRRPAHPYYCAIGRRSQPPRNRQAVTTAALKGQQLPSVHAWGQHAGD